MAKILIVGRPNVGKSTLFNTLIGEKKAIVERTPGVTRDLVEGYLELKEGKGVKLIDTGGIEWGGKEFFSEVIKKLVDQALEEADLVLFVVDAKQGLTEGDKVIAEYLRKKDKKILLVINKVEAKEDQERVFEFYSLGFPEIISISAKNKKNITELKNLIERQLEGSIEEIPQEEPIKIAILGRPNVGKSTLINRLVGYERVIVSEIPGTTRDCVDVRLSLPTGESVLLIDTPGIRRRTRLEERVEKFAVDKALHTIEKVDVVLMMITAEEGITNQDQRLLRQVYKHHKACILLVNKWDLFDKKREAGNLVLENIKYGVRFMPWLPILTISAKTGRRVKEIWSVLKEVMEQYSLRVNTAQVNKLLEYLKENHNFSIKGKKLKFYYATQTDIKPPTFVVFINFDPEEVPKSIEKFIRNSFQKHLNFDKVPIKVVFRLRS
ncbi:MAG: GTPase Der [Thermodesulfobacterium sp. 37_54]|jgi:GTP-binding protein|uniref:GTPase Der n=2 Tax=Thermodesulfobacterium commune TaxID=1741 RepID=A0A075WRR0_9BACT|nr:ribosome biogenesis GTPase Der [Thermodesulfobacterium commune]KUJ97330.1 MAG: GTPase Der [Thermodesulfobacterium sp. 37_54]AIH03541.1 GTPase EngA [Thermodesulfobacterium commune DSM 2178]KUK19141.1 MAG: GTPase Der [Thermodesulfobacterium commune]KUK38441.1 MAG: GTPase Der [Thermodesulfobacterium commune]HAA84195.1 ribosome biogenesis GTPase Der [Thermodesulfobacterium commune]